MIYETGTQNMWENIRGVSCAPLYLIGTKWVWESFPTLQIPTLPSSLHKRMYPRGAVVIRPGRVWKFAGQGTTAECYPHWVSIMLTDSREIGDHYREVTELVVSIASNYTPIPFTEVRLHYYPSRSLGIVESFLLLEYAKYWLQLIEDKLDQPYSEFARNLILSNSDYFTCFRKYSTR